MTKTQPVLMPQTTYEYLNRVIQLLSAPRRDPHNPSIITHEHSWIQDAEAIDSNNNHCSPESDLAVAYCTIGAVRAVTSYDPSPTEAYKYVISIIDAANPQVILATQGVPQINDDSHDFQRVIKMLIRAQQFVSRWITKS